ncbi:acyl-CoA oxidase [Lactarius pseudohatsudake]|nr:acyl-CoA oxidase [Lactarius pseudohatsudake]
MSSLSAQIAAHPFFAVDVSALPFDERISLSYQRAQLVLRTYNLTAGDVLKMTPKFWEMHLDPTVALDYGLFTILSAQINLTVGTLSRFLPTRRDLVPLVKSLLKGETMGLFLLSERGHGLDALNIETTAHQQEDGSYVLHTPHEEATKFMPSSNPTFGMNKIALVMARLIIKGETGEDRGIRPFIVALCNTREHFPGILSIRLPLRSGASPFDYSMTRFNKVKLPATALISDTFEVPKDPRAAWWDTLWRIPIGSFAVSGPCVSGLKHTAYIGGKYSLRRLVAPRGEKIPIFTFPTQQWSVLHTVASARVLDAWYRDVAPVFSDPKTTHPIKHGLAVMVKATVIRQSMDCAHEMAERCGAQGTFDTNFIARHKADLDSVIIAEGDVLALCIRLWGELVFGRYTIPIPSAKESLLAKHAHGLLDEGRQVLRRVPGGHRSETAEYELPLEAERSVIRAWPRRAGVPQVLLDLYECAAIRGDPAWFSENVGLTRAEQRAKEGTALRAAAPDIEKHLEDLNIGYAVRASIVSDAAWLGQVERMPKYKGNAQSGIPGVTPGKDGARL